MTTATTATEWELVTAISHLSTAADLIAKAEAIAPLAQIAAFAAHLADVADDTQARQALTVVTNTTRTVDPGHAQNRLAKADRLANWVRRNRPEVAANPKAATTGEWQKINRESGERRALSPETWALTVANLQSTTPTTKQDAFAGLPGC